MNEETRRLSVENLVRDYVRAPEHLDAERVDRYVSMPESLPPVTVFDVGDRLLLVDGYHRVEAARLRGDGTIEAHVRHGSPDEVLEFVAAINQRDPQEVARRIRELYPDLWGRAPEDTVPD